jgi:hypothetical protein
MFELMIGIDGVQRRTEARVHKRRRRDDGEPSRLSALFTRRERKAEPARTHVPVTHPR